MRWRWIRYHMRIYWTESGGPARRCLRFCSPWRCCVRKKARDLVMNAIPVSRRRAATIPISSASRMRSRILSGWMTSECRWIIRSWSSLIRDLIRCISLTGRIWWPWRRRTRCLRRLRNRRSIRLSCFWRKMRICCFRRLRPGA